MFITRRSPVTRSGRTTPGRIPGSSGHSSGGAGEAVMMILATLGAIGGLAWVFTEL